MFLQEAQTSHGILKVFFWDFPFFTYPSVSTLWKTMIKADLHGFPGVLDQAEPSLTTQSKTSKQQELRRAQGETGRRGTEIFLNFKRVLVMLCVKPELIEFAWKCFSLFNWILHLSFSSFPTISFLARLLKECFKHTLTVQLTSKHTGLEKKKPKSTREKSSRARYPDIYISEKMQKILDLEDWATRRIKKHWRSS